MPGNALTSRARGVLCVGLRTLAVVALMAMAAFHAQAGERSAAAVREFKRASPCPVTGKATGACPGWVVDHVVPLCIGGADKPDNMQWQTGSAAKSKDRDEWRACRELRKTPP